MKATVIYSSCPPPLIQVTPFDYFVAVDVCHQGDLAPSGFFGRGCPGLGDGGRDPNQANDAPILRTARDTLR